MTPRSHAARLLVTLGALVATLACDGASGDLLTTIPEPEAPVTDYCVTRLATDTADPELCATTTTWLAIAGADCDGLALALVEDTLVEGNACDPDAAGRPRYLQARYDCCLPAGCRLELQDAGTTCLDEVGWRTRATSSCALAGQTLNGLLRRTPCADGITWSAVEYACCP